MAIGVCILEPNLTELFERLLLNRADVETSNTVRVGLRRDGALASGFPLTEVPRKQSVRGRKDLPEAHGFVRLWRGLRRRSTS
jgi:hypothetical protein